jgi:DNA-binding response OmpR family regulator
MPVMHNPPLILLVDDDAQLIDLFYTKLTAAGFAVKKAYNGKMVLRRQKKRSPI